MRRRMARNLGSCVPAYADFVGDRIVILDAIDHIVFNVRDVEASAKWYEQVLGMARIDAPSDSGALRTSVTFGRSKINLRPIDASQDEWFTGATPCAGGQDLCFLTSFTPDAVVAHLQACDVEIEVGPVTKNGARGPIRSVYVRDPDGNLIEVSSYAALA